VIGGVTQGASSEGSNNGPYGGSAKGVVASAVVTYDGACKGAEGASRYSPILGVWAGANASGAAECCSGGNG
jgi:hypothetical protein